MDAPIGDTFHAVCIIAAADQDSRLFWNLVHQNTNPCRIVVSMNPIGNRRKRESVSGLCSLPFCSSPLPRRRGAGISPQPPSMLAGVGFCSRELAGLVILRVPP